MIKKIVRAALKPKKTIKIVRKRYMPLDIDDAISNLKKSTENRKKEGLGKPKVSIILLTFNNLKYTKACLYSILAYSDTCDLELVIVDNNSSDGTPEFLGNFAEEHKNVKLTLNKTNKGFSGGCNQGIKKATGEYIIFLNNDTIVTPGWVEKLILPLKDKKVGLVGPLTNFMWNHQEIDIFYRSLGAMLKKSSVVTNRNKGKVREADDIAFFCVAARTELIRKIGELDERFGIGMFEDDDYCLRVVKSGYKIVVAKDVFVHHFGQISLFSLGKGKYNELFEENKKKFEEKWGIKWEETK